MIQKVIWSLNLNTVFSFCIHRDSWGITIFQLDFMKYFPFPEYVILLIGNR